MAKAPPSAKRDRIKAFTPALVDYTNDVIYGTRLALRHAAAAGARRRDHRGRSREGETGGRTREIRLMLALVVESVHQAIDRIRRDMGIGGILVEQDVAVALGIAAHA
jgi:hypothetical protein